MQEIWDAIPNYKESYQVSNLGWVKSLGRIITNKQGKKRIVLGRYLKPKCNKQGYVFVTLSSGGRTSTHYIHRLIASAFILNPEKKPFVNHIDGNPGNNAIENLEWVTHQENVQHAYDMGLNSNQGEGHFMSTGIVDKELGMEFSSIKEWCEARNINYSTGRNLLNGYSTTKRIDISGVIKKQSLNNGRA